MSEEISVVISKAKVNKEKLKDVVVTVSDDMLEIGTFRLKIKKFTRVEYNKPGILTKLLAYTFGIPFLLAFLYFLGSARMTDDVLMFVLYGTLSTLFFFLAVKILSIAHRPAKLIIRDFAHYIELQDSNDSKIRLLYDKLLRATYKKQISA